MIRTVPIGHSTGALALVPGRPRRVEARDLLPGGRQALGSHLLPLTLARRRDLNRHRSMSLFSAASAA
jgi:hypothetical protein